MSLRGGIYRVTLALFLGSSVAAAKSSPAPRTPPPPPVSVRLSLKDMGPGTPWAFRLENASAGHIRVADDTKLLWLEVSIPGKSKPHVCKLPSELVPKTVTDKSMKELGPGESLVRRVDARFYCFDAGKQKILVPTAQVIPHYGFPTKTLTKWVHGKKVEEPLSDEAPFAAVPVDSTTDGPAKNVTGDPIVLDARYAVWSSGPDEDDKPDDDGDAPELEMTRGSDAKDEMSARATVRVENPGRSRVTVFVRRELLTFEVLTPRGTMTCSADREARNPERRAFTTLTARNSLTLVSRLVEFCPRGTFGIPGLYLVKATLDADVDGSEYGLNAFTGSLTTSRAVPVRIRRPIHIVPNHKLLQQTPGAPGILPGPNGLPASANPGMIPAMPAPTPGAPAEASPSPEPVLPSN